MDVPDIWKRRPEKVGGMELIAWALTQVAEATAYHAEMMPQNVELSDIAKAITHHVDQRNGAPACAGRADGSADTQGPAY